MTMAGASDATRTSGPASNASCARLRVLPLKLRIRRPPIGSIRKNVNSASIGGERVLYVLDEPTTGLHFDDIAKLLAAFRKLLHAGHSLLVIEHNLDVVKTADWLIDLGPEGGEAGGHIVAIGSPEHVATVESSYTGQFLRRVLAAGREHAYADQL